MRIVEECRECGTELREFNSDGGRDFCPYCNGGPGAQETQFSLRGDCFAERIEYCRTADDAARILSLSPHPFKLSDGTECPAQNQRIVDLFTLRREVFSHSEIRGMQVNETRMVLSEEQRQALYELCRFADVVIIPFPVLTALREAGTEARGPVRQSVRDWYPNALAFNATLETQRSAPTEKVVDLQNWSY